MKGYYLPNDASGERKHARPMPDLVICMEKKSISSKRGSITYRAIVGMTNDVKIRAAERIQSNTLRVSVYPPLQRKDCDEAKNLGSAGGMPVSICAASVSRTCTGIRGCRSSPGTCGSTTSVPEGIVSCGGHIRNPKRLRVVASALETALSRYCTFRQQ